MSDSALDPSISTSVAASAGTGKTWLLTARIVRLLLAGANPSGILALTFTRKAAAEMRVRVNQRLRALAEADDAGLDQLLKDIEAPLTDDVRLRARDLYRQQLFSAYPLRTTTLHAFCQDLISRFAFEAEVTPGFKLVEQEAALYAQAWRQLQTRILRQPQSTAARAFTTLAELGYGEYRLRTLVTGFLQRRSDWRALGEDAQTRLLAELQDTLNVRGDSDPTEPLQSPAFRCHLKELAGMLKQGGKVGSVTPENVGAAVDALDTNLYEKLRVALLRLDGAPFAFNPPKSKYNEAQRDSLMGNYRPVMDAVEQTQRRARALESLKRNQAAYALGTSALAEFDRELARENALTFAEIEWRAYRLLQREEGAEWVRYKLDQSIDHLLLDEFQDTNPTQWRLLLPLLQEMAAGDSGRGRSAFIVGDAKQSIYGFRRAQPELFEVAANWLQKSLGAGPPQTQTRTRRSAPAVVDFVNALFADTRGDTIGFKPHSTTREQDWGRVEVAPLIERDEAPDADAGLRDPLTQKRQSREENRAQHEAQQVAARITTLVASGVAVHDPHGSHRIGFGDVMVLARQREHLPDLEQALSRAKIPFSGAARGTLLETSEARDLTALLRWLAAPHCNLELAQVLRSPLLSLSDDTLIQLARSDAGHWLTALQQRAETELPLQRPVQLLSHWRDLSPRLPVHDLLDRVIVESDAARRYESALPPAAAARVRANLGAFQQLALAADSGRYPSLTGFLEHLDEQLTASKDAPDEAPSAGARGQVRILTIHAAKGLESPAVFIVNAGSAVDRSKPAPWLVEWPAEAPCPRSFIALGRKSEHDTLSAALLEQQKSRDERENLNLLYVACTRARQFLHISGFVSGREKTSATTMDGENAARGRMPEPPGNTWHAWALQAMSALKSKSENETQVHALGTPEASTATPARKRPVVDPRLQKPLPLIKRAAPPSGESRPAFDPEAAARGDAIHFLLQKLATHVMDDGPLLAGLEQHLGCRVAANDYRLWRDEAGKVLDAKALLPFFKAGVRAWNEVPLLDAAGEGGIADRIVDDGTTLWVVDYKTTPDPDAALLRERYRPQIEDYLHAARAVWPGRDVRGGLILTATREWLEITA
ncbi:MAG: UvrD-helicase domain-containing protein [Pseudomonadota bacterium]